MSPCFDKAEAQSICEVLGEAAPAFVSSGSAAINYMAHVFDTHSIMLSLLRCDGADVFIPFI